MSADRPDRPADPIRFRSSDGTELVGELEVPSDPWAAAVVCHPHPRYGGNRFHPIVGAIHHALPSIGIASLRFDVRTVFDDGVGERRDTSAAIAEIRRAVPDVPVAAVGYSFGAIMALDSADDQCMAIVGVAPPLATTATVAAPSRPTLLITPEFDQFTGPDAARIATAGWPDVVVDTIPGADHFLSGRHDDIAARVCEFLLGHRSQRR